VVAVCPEDVAIGQPQALTSVSIPATRIGAVAVEMVMHRLDHGQEAETRLLAPELTARTTTAPAS
jgi:DNA-binding LacI/PurR family transcriptional regulator